jgi:uncharacterized surface protein with fasciclin (FAS1) repeats
MTNRIKLAILALAGSMSLMVIAPAAASAHSYNHWDHKNHHKNHHWKHHKSDQPNIVETAVAINKETGEFSTLIAAVSCTNLVNRLQNEHRSFTVFAPTDAAFAKLNLNATNVCKSFDKAALTNILSYHVTRGSKDASEVLSKKKLWMLSGDKAVISGATIDGQNIVKTDVKTSNGIIHVIDGVMLP